MPAPDSPTSIWILFPGRAAITEGFCLSIEIDILASNRPGCSRTGEALGSTGPVRKP
jgi:hypothetical protein